MLPNLTPFNILCVSTANKRCNKVSKHTIVLNGTVQQHGISTAFQTTTQ